MGDQRRVRQAISNTTVHAIQNTTQDGVKVEMYVVARPSKTQMAVEVAVTDSGVGMSVKELDQLFNDLEQLQSEPAALLGYDFDPGNERFIEQSERTTLGLGLAIVARIVKNMDGQLRMKSEEGKGSRSIIQFPFILPDSEPQVLATVGSSEGSLTSLASSSSTVGGAGERTLVASSCSGNDSDNGETVVSEPDVASVNSAKTSELQKRL
ncbi:hsp90-like protein [Paraphaeosphaeria sporulosa]